jgi:hypothetical protein
MKRYCVVFAGAMGSSKTPIACYLSETLGLPVFNGDAIRTEVKEDKGWFDIPEFDWRRETRLRALLGLGASFIHDASIDRAWDKLRPELAQAGYEPFVISLDLSKDFLKRLYDVKAYDLKVLDKYFADHQTFVEYYDKEVNLHITDETFQKRLSLALDSVRKWVDEGEMNHG